MKWFFRISAVIFALFGLIVIVGATQSEVQVIERSAVIDADAGAVFDQVDDLRQQARWSHAAPGPDVPPSALAFGQQSGAGASAAWEGPKGVGSAEILQSVEPGLVLVSVQTGARAAVLTYAIAEEGGQTLIVARQEREFGGFPYLDRVAAKLREGRDTAAIDASLAQLATLVREA